MKSVAIIGAGWMTKPMVDYLMERCGFFVTVVNRTLSKAEDVIAGRDMGKAIRWSTEEPESLDRVVAESDLAISMVPKPVHIHVARACLNHRKHMLTTAYEIPELVALDGEAKEKGVLILNELGEVPGMDHMGTQLVLERVRRDGGRVIRLDSYGSGLPSFEFNRNPFGYKFSWDPRTVFVAAQTAAAYLKNGKRVEVPGDRLFEHFWYVDIEGLGTFESYPNKDVQKYVEPFGLDDDVSFYRGLLRFSGYCNNMLRMLKLGLFDTEGERGFEGVTYRQFMASLIEGGSPERIERDVARYLGVGEMEDIIHRLRWLGLFDDRPVAIEHGSNLDVLLDRMLAKMSYQPDERDMILLHIDILAEYPGGGRKREQATMRVEGIPGGESAMSRAVGLPAAVAAKLVMEGTIQATGAKMPPTLPELARPLMDEMDRFGFEFKHRTIEL